LDPSPFVEGCCKPKEKGDNPNVSMIIARYATLETNQNQTYSIFVIWLRRCVSTIRYTSFHLDDGK